MFLMREKRGTLKRRRFLVISRREKARKWGKTVGNKYESISRDVFHEAWKDLIRRCTGGRESKEDI